MEAVSDTNAETKMNAQYLPSVKPQSGDCIIRLPAGFTKLVTVKSQACRSMVDVMPAQLCENTVWGNRLLTQGLFPCTTRVRTQLQRQGRKGQHTDLVNEPCAECSL